MAESTNTGGTLAGIDWRLRMSMGFTLVWLLLGFIYISSIVGWGPFVSQQAPALGGFLEGAFAPLAFLWLVVGFFLQQRQLENNTATIERQLVQMERTAEQAEIQSRAIAADELHSRQDTFLRINDMVNAQLGVIAGFVVTSFLPELGDEYFDGPDGLGQLWRESGAGDNTAFDRKIFQLTYSGTVDSRTLFWGTEIRSNHTRSFVFAFERLMRIGERCDPEGIISDAIRQGSHGRIYKIMVETRPEGAASAPAG